MSTRPPEVTSGNGPSQDRDVPVVVLKGSGIGPVVSVAEGQALLDSITSKSPATAEETSDWLGGGEVLGLGGLAKRLNVTRGTIDNWRKARRIIALRKGVRNFVSPVDQFDLRKSAPLAGIDRVLAIEHFASPEAAWEWLVSFNRMTGNGKPIDALRDGHVDEVISAAGGAYDFS
jgi:hypothetical protein